MDCVGPRIPRFRERTKEPQDWCERRWSQSVWRPKQHTQYLARVLCIYNLPPWKCMKKKYITMCMLVQGPKQPGTDLNLYLQLLKEELEMLWKDGVNTWDAAAKEYFLMKVAVITTVQDYLGLGYFSGQVVQGLCACVRCMDNTTYRQLEKDPGSSKTVFQGSRRWLPKKHAWRKLGHLFDGSEELRAPPARRSGKEIHNLLKTWEGCPAPGKKRRLGR